MLLCISKEITSITKLVQIGIYCAKGGLRSNSIALILSSIGYQVLRLKGGYKSYRNSVISYLDALPHQKFIVLGGNTGCGKSELLKTFNAIDLEYMANHLAQPLGVLKENNLAKKCFKTDF